MNGPDREIGGIGLWIIAPILYTMLAVGIIYNKIKQ